MALAELDIAPDIHFGASPRPEIASLQRRKTPYSRMVDTTLAYWQTSFDMWESMGRAAIGFPYEMMRLATDPKAYQESQQIRGELRGALREYREFQRNPIRRETFAPSGKKKKMAFFCGYKGSPLDPFSQAHVAWMGRMGFEVHQFAIAQNNGQEVTWRSAVNLVDQLAEEAERDGNPGVVVGGHSMGGIMARYAIHQLPDAVSHAIIVGSLSNGNIENLEDVGSSFVANSLRRDCGRTASERARVEAKIEQSLAPLPESVMDINVASEGDFVIKSQYGINVHPRALTIQGGDRPDLQPFLTGQNHTLNIVMQSGTHLGLIVNSEVCEEIRDNVIPLIYPNVA